MKQAIGGPMWVHLPSVMFDAPRSRAVERRLQVPASVALLAIMETTMDAEIRRKILMLLEQHRITTVATLRPDG